MNTYRDKDRSDVVIGTMFGLANRGFGLLLRIGAVWLGLTVVIVIASGLDRASDGVPLAVDVVVSVLLVGVLLVSHLGWTRARNQGGNLPAAQEIPAPAGRPSKSYDEEGYVVYHYYNDQGQRLDYHTNPKFGQ